MTVSSTMRYPPATVNNRRHAKSRSVCPDQGPWSMRVQRSWETLSNASAMAEHVVRLVKYSNAMRYIHSGSGIDAHLPSESLCLFLCGLPVTRISCHYYLSPTWVSEAELEEPSLAELARVIKAGACIEIYQSCNLHKTLFWQKIDSYVAKPHNKSRVSR